MTEERIQRLNELARKNKAEGLTEAELSERTLLREEYLSAIRSSLEAQLDNTYILDENGEKRKLEKKES